MRLALRNGTTAIFSLMVLAIACKDAVSPDPSAISISVKVAGVFPSDRFQIELDGRPMTLLTSEANLVVRSLSEGPHTVSLVGLPSNCTTEGSSTATVEASAGQLAAVEFRVSCLAATGAIAVAVTVEGTDRQLWFPAEVDSADSRENVRGNGTTVLLGSFAAGVHVVRLSGIPHYCEPTGELTSSVNVKTNGVSQDTATASFSMKCEPPELGSNMAAEIAFERDGYVMVVSDSGGSAVALTQGEKPAWSPDGKLISFERTKCELYQVCERDLWLMTPGETPKIVSKDENFDDFDSAISPNGTSLAFIRFWLGPDQSYLAVSRLDGSSVRLLSIWHPVSTPTWSPDAAKIAFVCWGGLGTYKDLCAVNTDISCTAYLTDRCSLPDPIRLTANVGDESDPVWSPDGRRIAFTLGCATGLGNVPASQIPCPAGIAVDEPYIAVMDVTTREVTQIVAGHDPSWSPDGSQVVFAGNASAPGLRVYSFGNRTVRQLTSNPLDSSPSWRE